MNVEQYLNYVSDDWSKGWLQNDVTSQRGVFVPHEYMALADHNAYDAMLLAQIYYWGGIDPKTLRPRMTHQYGNHLWIVKTFTEWAEELHFKNERSIREGLKRLAEKKLIIKERHKSPFHESKIVTYVRQNWEEFGKAMQQRLTKNVDPEPTKNVDPELTKNVDPELTKNVDPELTKNGGSLNTETTTKTNTETTTKTTTTSPSPHPSLLLSSDQPGQKLSEDSNSTTDDESYIASTILDLLSRSTAEKLINKYGYESVYRVCCYVQQANTDKPPAHHLKVGFIYAELNGKSQNIPANYQAPTDYHKWFNNTVSAGAQPETITPEDLPVKESQPTEVDNTLDSTPPPTIPAGEGAWQATINQLKFQLPENAYKIFLYKAKFREIQHDTYIVEVNSSRSRKALDGLYYQIIQTTLRQISDTQSKIRFCIEGETVTIQEPNPPIVADQPKPVMQIVTSRPIEPDEPITPEMRAKGRALFDQLVNASQTNAKNCGDVSDLVRPEIRAWGRA